MPELSSDKDFQYFDQYPDTGGDDEEVSELEQQLFLDF